MGKQAFRLTSTTPLQDSTHFYHPVFLKVIYHNNLECGDRLN